MPKESKPKYLREEIYKTPKLTNAIQNKQRDMESQNENKLTQVESPSEEDWPLDIFANLGLPGLATPPSFDSAALKRQRMEALLPLMEQELPPEREALFFAHPTALRAGNVFMRAFKCPNNLIYYVHFVKMIFGENQAKDNTFLKVNNNK